MLSKRVKYANESHPVFESTSKTGVNHYIYGSSRIGLFKPDLNLTSSYTYPANPVDFSDVLGKRNYEQTNHLGNVLTVITDNKIPAQTVNTFDNGSLDGWAANNGGTQSTVTSSAGALQVSVTAAGAGAYKAYPTNAGTLYQFSCNITEGTIPNPVISVFNTTPLYRINRQVQYGTVDHPMVFMGTGNPVNIEIAGLSATGALSVDNAVLKEIGTVSITDSANFNNGNTSGWLPYGSATVTVEQGRLKCSAPIKGTTGLTKTFNTIPGKQYYLRHKFEITTPGVPSINCFVRNSSNSTIADYSMHTGLQLNAEGFTASTAQTTVIMLYPSWGSATPPIVYYLDDVSLESVDNYNTEDYVADVQSTTDYYAFGSPMPGRNYNATSYRYGFNGKENDPEDGYQDYGMRQYDPRLGRFPSPDPLIVSDQQYPELSPYQFAGNSPIENSDLDGLEPNSEIINPNTGLVTLKVPRSDHFPVRLPENNVEYDDELPINIDTDVTLYGTTGSRPKDTKLIDIRKSRNHTKFIDIPSISPLLKSLKADHKIKPIKNPEVKIKDKKVGEAVLEEEKPIQVKAGNNTRTEDQKYYYYVNSNGDTILVRDKRTNENTDKRDSKVKDQKKYEESRKKDEEGLNQQKQSNNTGG